MNKYLLILIAFGMTSVSFLFGQFSVQENGKILEKTVEIHEKPTIIYVPKQSEPRPPEVKQPDPPKPKKVERPVHRYIPPTPQPWHEFPDPPPFWPFTRG